MTYCCIRLLRSLTVWEPNCTLQLKSQSSTLPSSITPELATRPTLFLSVSPWSDGSELAMWVSPSPRLFGTFCSVWEGGGWNKGGRRRRQSDYRQRMRGVQCGIKLEGDGFGWEVSEGGVIVGAGKGCILGGLEAGAGGDFWELMVVVEVGDTDEFVGITGKDGWNWLGRVTLYEALDSCNFRGEWIHFSALEAVEHSALNINRWINSMVNIWDAFLFFKKLCD